MITVYIALASICILFVVIAHVRAHPISFYLGSGHYGPIISAMSIVAAFTGGGAIINTSGLAAKYGNWAYFDVIPAVVGLLLAALLVRIKFFGKNFSATFFDVNSALYDKKAITVHYAQIALLYTLVIAAQLRAVATVAIYVDLPAWFAVALCCITVAAYAFRGFDAVTRTDVVQLLLMLPMYMILTYIAFEPNNTGTSIAVSQQVAMPIPLAIALCLPAFFLPISQEIHQRGASVANKEAVGKSYVIASVLYLVLGSLLVTAFSHTPTLDFMAIVKGPNPVAAVLVAVGILSAILSTLDTSTNIASHAAEQLPRMNRVPSAVIQVLLLTIGSVLFLFFPTVLSLILFALFVYMAGPALSFIAVYSGIHPRQSAIIGSIFVALQTAGQFKYTALTHLPHIPAIIRSLDNVQIGLILLLIQVAVLVVFRIYRRFA